jgi:PAS domain S-box-containing protein
MSNYLCIAGAIHRRHPAYASAPERLSPWRHPATIALICKPISEGCKTNVFWFQGESGTLLEPISARRRFVPFWGKIVQAAHSTTRDAWQTRAMVIADLETRIREIADPDELAYAAAEILGRHFDVSRAGYGTIDLANETISIERDWNAPGISSLAGTLNFRDYGSYIEDLKRGETVVFDDAETDPRTYANANALKAISAQSVVNVPVTEHGGFVALLYLNHATPRTWREDDLALISEVAHRTRTAVERLRAEQALRESEARLKFLDSLGKAIAVVTDAEAIMKVTTRLLGEHLDVSICAYADMEPDQDHFTIRGDWGAPGSPSIAGYYSLADFGRLAVANLGAGHPLIVNDNRAELGPEEAQTFLDIGIAATICMPLVKQGRLTALMAIHDKRPRVWTERELDLLSEVTERSWAHIERVRSEQAARASEERLRLATDAASIGTWDFNPITGQLRWDDKCKALFGLPSETEITYDTFLRGLHPDDRVRADQAVKDALSRSEGSSRFSIEYRTIASNGVERWVAAAGDTVFEDEVAVRFIGVVIDITARKKAEEALHLLNATLEQRVLEEVAERAKAEENLRQMQKMEAVGQLTGGIAHDFNNMLAVIMGGLNLVQRRLIKGDNDVLQYVDGAMDGAKRAAELTQRLLAFSRQQPLAPKHVNINRLVGGMSDLLTRTLGETIQVETVLGAGLWRVEVDPAQLESALLNLSVNARDAMVSGGKLTIETSNAHIDRQYARDYSISEGQYVLVAVTDTGVGMPADILAKAFDPFFTTKGVGKGTGLGLSQVYGFVTQSGGHVKIYSELGVGTTVKIYLPRSHGDQAEDPGPQQTVVHPGAPHETIMVVEDDDRVRVMAIEALQELGYSVLEMRGPLQALDAIQRGAQPSLMFTDVVMPDMSGSELVAKVKLLRPDLKVLYTTGYTRNAIVHNGTLDFGTELLTKPYTIEELAAKIRMILDRQVRSGALLPSP